ncbi:hypothetical protein [Streptomyces fractus]|uniref:hypothetical protein n=1 Tax=Streptomyces fractus TaxID=641806 RepID=UPI003CF73FDB
MSSWSPAESGARTGTLDGTEAAPTGIAARMACLDRVWGVADRGFVQRREVVPHSVWLRLYEHEGPPGPRCDRGRIGDLLADHAGNGGPDHSAPRLQQDPSEGS